MFNSQTIWKKVMTKKTRRRYTTEFKAAAVARLDEPGQTLSSVAQALGVAATQVKTWRLKQQAAGSAEAVARRRAEASELQQLGEHFWWRNAASHPDCPVTPNKDAYQRMGQ
jgi:transposase